MLFNYVFSNNKLYFINLAAFVKAKHKPLFAQFETFEDDKLILDEFYIKEDFPLDKSIYEQEFSKVNIVRV